jgi:sensor histidine kinase YesM
MQSPPPILSRLLSERHRVWQHGAFIFLIFFFWFLFRVRYTKTVEDVVQLVLYSLTYVGVAYLNMNVLFPRLLLKGRPWTYLGVSVLTFIVSYVAQQLIYFETPEQLRSDLELSLPLIADMCINAITYCMFIGIGLSARFIKKWMNSEIKVRQLEEESLRARLNSLKNQVSPHFLFNTFNNLYVLTRTRPDLASEMILGFSDLMRYQLNESEKEYVSIDNEIRYIENFLTLEKLRKDQLDLRFNYDSRSLSGIQVQPLLFITLVENAVKHGSQRVEDAFIHVDLYRTGETLHLLVKNSKPLTQPANLEKSGKGIENLRNRLRLSYPSRHELVLDDLQNVFSARLQLQLS